MILSLINFGKKKLFECNINHLVVSLLLKTEKTVYRRS